MIKKVTENIYCRQLIVSKQQSAPSPPTHFYGTGTNFSLTCPKKESYENSISVFFFALFFNFCYYNNFFGNLTLNSQYLNKINDKFTENEQKVLKVFKLLLNIKETYYKVREGVKKGQIVTFWLPPVGQKPYFCGHRQKIRVFFKIIFHYAK